MKKIIQTGRGANRKGVCPSTATQLLLIQTTLLFSFLLMLQGCQTYNFDESEFFKNHSYNSDKPFTMRSATINAPLFSKRNQLNLSFEMTHGVGVNIAAAVSDKVEVLAGASILTGSGESNEYRTVPATVYDPHTGPGGAQTDSSHVNLRIYYNLISNLNQNSAYVAVGKYKTFGGHGRWENFVGMAYGTAINEYIYSLTDYPASYAFTESRHYWQYFLQDDFGYVTPHSEGAIITRLSYIHFSSQSFQKSYPVDEYPMVIDNLVLEPAAKFGVGGKAWRFYLRCGWNIPLTASDLQGSPADVRAGLVFRIQ